MGEKFFLIPYVDNKLINVSQPQRNYAVTFPVDDPVKPTVIIKRVGYNSKVILARFSNMRSCKFLIVLLTFLSLFAHIP